MKHPLSRCAASLVCTAPSLASREGAYGQPATPSLRGGAAGPGPCSVSLLGRVRLTGRGHLLEP